MTTAADMTSKVDQESPELDAAFDEAAEKVDSQPDGALDIPDIDEVEKPKKEKAAKPESVKEKAKKDKPVEKVEESESKEEVESSDEKVKDESEAEGEGEESAEEKEPKSAKERIEEEMKGKSSEKDDGEKTPVIDALPAKYSWAKEAVKTEEFVKFVMAQPKAIQKMANSGDIDDAMYVLDLYKSAKEAAKEVKLLAKKFGGTKFTAPDGTQKTITEMADEYGNEELLEAFASMTNAMMDERINNIQKTDSDYKAALEQQSKRIDEMIAESRYWDEVMDVHPDAKKILRSGKLGEWVDKQSDSIKWMFKTSRDAAHAILIYDAYKEDMAKESSKSGTDKKEKRDSLYSDSLSGKREVKSKASEKKQESEDDYDRGFEEGSK